MLIENIVIKHPAMYRSTALPALITLMIHPMTCCLLYELKWIVSCLLIEKRQE